MNFFLSKTFDRKKSYETSPIRRKKSRREVARMNQILRNFSPNFKSEVRMEGYMSEYKQKKENLIFSGSYSKRRKSKNLKKGILRRGSKIGSKAISFVKLNRERKRSPKKKNFGKAINDIKSLCMEIDALFS